MTRQPPPAVAVQTYFFFGSDLSDSQDVPQGRTMKCVFVQVTWTETSFFSDDSLADVVFLHVALAGSSVSSPADIAAWKPTGVDAPFACCHHDIVD